MDFIACNLEQLLFWLQIYSEVDSNLNEISVS